MGALVVVVEAEGQSQTWIYSRVIVLGGYFERLKMLSQGRYRHLEVAEARAFAYCFCSGSQEEYPCLQSNEYVSAQN